MTTITDQKALLERALEKILTCWPKSDPLVNEIRAALAAQPAKPLFAELIAQHEGLAEELAAMDGPAWHDAPNAPDRCWCQTCRPITPTDYRMVLCPECGNKRCPKATDHRNACTGSNEPGQPGSSYPAITAIELPCWRSAPTSAGVWLNRCDGSCTVVTNDECEWANAGMAAGRWFGPISPDKIRSGE